MTSLQLSMNFNLLQPKAWSNHKSSLKLLITEVDNPSSVRFLDQTPIIEWYVIWYGSKNETHYVWNILDCMLKIW